MSKLFIASVRCVSFSNLIFESFYVLFFETRLLAFLFKLKNENLFNSLQEVISHIILLDSLGDFKAKFVLKLHLEAFIVRSRYGIKDLDLFKRFLFISYSFLNLKIFKIVHLIIDSLSLKS